MNLENKSTRLDPTINRGLSISYGDCCGLNNEILVTNNNITYSYYTDIKRREAYKSRSAKVELLAWANLELKDKASGDDEFILNPDLKVNLHNASSLNDEVRINIDGKSYSYFTDIKRRDSYRLAIAKTFSDFEQVCSKDESKLIANKLQVKLDEFKVTDSHLRVDCGRYTIYNASPEYLRDSFEIASISIDAEWNNKKLMTFLNKKGYPTHLISKQASIFDSRGRRIHIVLIDDKFPQPSDKVFHFLNEPVIFYYGDIQEYTVPQVIYDLDLKFEESDIPVYLFYSPNDLKVMLQTNTLKEMYRGYPSENKVDKKKGRKKGKSVFTKKRNLQGRFNFLECLHKADDPLEEFFNSVTNGEKNKKYKRITFQLRDLIGTFNTSLDKAFDLVGMSNITKDLVDPKRKNVMGEVACENMDLFFFYLLGDTMNTPKLWELRVNQINRIINDSLGFDPEFNIEDCPRTSGALVSQVFMLWLEKKHPYILAGVEALANPHEKKHSVFDLFLEQLPLQKENVSKGFIVLKHIKCDGKLIPVPTLLRDLHKEWNYYDHEEGESLDGIAGMARASIGGFVSHCNDNTMFNAIVFGGRCNNENPLVWNYLDVFDIDLSSCYGTALRTLDYTFGRPFVIDGTLGKDKYLTYEKFVQKYVVGTMSNKFAPGECMWQAVLDSPTDDKGKIIPFKTVDQDYFYGKPTVSITSMKNDASKGYRQVNDENEHDNNAITTVEKTHITGSLMQARKEVFNTVVTQHDILPIVNNIASNQERRELNNLSVKTAAGYLAKDEVLLEEGDGYSTVDEKFYDLMSNRKTRGEWKSKSLDDTKTIDLRNHHWVRLPLEEFIGSIIDYRKKLKNLKKKCINDGDTFKANTYDVEQNACKLFINTLYGCLASPFFPLSNTILANNITSKARFGVWQINKALGTAMSITDGGAYSNNYVRFLNPSKDRDRKPSLSALSNYDQLNNFRAITTGKLVSDFDNFYQDCKNGKSKSRHEELDQIATAHINKFWSHWGLSLKFDIEHKSENTCKRMVVYNKSDYLFLQPLRPDKSCSVSDHSITKIVDYCDRHSLNEGEVIDYTPKVRGARQDDHPKKLWLFVLANIIKLEHSNIHFLYEQLIGVNAYIQSANKKDPYKKEWTDHLLPGETLLLETNFNPTTNFLPKNHYKDFKEHERSRINRKKSLEKRIEENSNYLNDLLAVILNDGMLDEEVFSAVLRHGGDEFIGSVVKPHQHQRTSKALRRFIIKYKSAKTLTKR